MMSSGPCRLDLFAELEGSCYTVLWNYGMLIFIKWQVVLIFWIVSNSLLRRHFCFFESLYCIFISDSYKLLVLAADDIFSDLVQHESGCVGWWIGWSRNS